MRKLKLIGLTLIIIFTFINKSIAQETFNVLRFKDANLIKVLETLSKLLNINIVIDDDVPVNKKITIFVEDLAPDTALELILLSNGLKKKQIDKKTIIVYPQRNQERYEEQQIFRVYHLKHVKPMEVTRLLKGISKNMKIYSDEERNVIVIYDTASNIKKADSLITSVDIQKTQALVSIELLEVDSEKLKELGIEQTQTSYSIKNFRSEMKEWPLKLVLIKNASSTTILAKPRLRLLESEKAKIHIGDRIPIEITTNTASPSGGNNIQIEKRIEWVDVGVKLNLEVKRIHGNNTVTMNIETEVSSIIKFTKEGYPEIRTRKAETKINARNGETVVIGGLISDHELTSFSKMPYLDRIPILRDFLKKRKRRKNRSEIIMLVTSYIVDSSTFKKKFDADKNFKYLNTAAKIKKADFQKFADKNLSIAAHSKKVSSYFQHAFLALLDKNYKSALVYLLKVIKINPYHADAYYLLGDIYKKLKEKNKAVRFYKLGLKLSPTHKKAKYVKIYLNKIKNKNM